MRGVTKTDRISRSSGRNMRILGKRALCTCYYCVGRETARWSKREAAILSEPIEAEDPYSLDEALADEYHERETNCPHCESPWWPLDDEDLWLWSDSGPLRVTLLEAL